VSIREIQRRIPVGDDGVHLAASLFAPAPGQPVNNAVLFFFPGGGYNRHYFDLQPDGFEGYSQCRYHAAQGHVCIAIDHAGVGDSSPVTTGENAQDEPPSLAGLARLNDAAVRTLLTELTAGTCIPELAPLPAPVAIGVGQSMGGHIVAIAQANHTTFDGIALLGSSFTRTRLALRPGARPAFRSLPLEQQIALDMGSADMAAAFHTSDHMQALVERDTDPDTPAPWHSATVPAAAADLMQPAMLAREAAAVHVPVLLVYGEVDVTAEPLDDVRAFTGTADIALLLVRRMGHMHNFSPARGEVWRRIEQFADAVAAAREHA
jgi:alpha-beta hydrolase superfamily lysophospholipase